MGALKVLPHRIGFHLSIGDGLPKSVERGRERGCTAMQIFCGNPRGWRLQDRTDEELAAFAAARAEADIARLFVHACYLINPCSSDALVFRRSIRRLAKELELSAAMGADCYVLHPGSHKGRAADWGIDRAAQAIGAALSRAERAPCLLLENMASAHGPGHSIASLGALAARLREHALGREVGIAIDSCHAFGAGYDLRETAAVERLVADVADAVGTERLKLLHVNDSRDEPGSGRDRHAHIGKGTIGRRGLRNFVAHPALASVPKILETPWESVAVDRRNLRAVLSLLRAQA
jgi:deoxyribonuclease-4